MKKSKSRVKGLIALLCTIPALYSCFAQERTYVDIENEFFTGDLVSGNQSVVNFNDYGAYGFGYFFIQGHSYNIHGYINSSGIYVPFTTSEGPDITNVTLEHNGHTITCISQLHGYYTTNFLNFGMFPIDQDTANRTNNGIQIVTGGLFTNCKTASGINLAANNVYGYIKRQYGENGENTHEIWAGITETGWEIKQSNLQIASGNIDQFYSTITGTTRISYTQYRQNENIALSGMIYDSVAKKSYVSPHFIERILLDIPNDYFERTKAISGNRDEAYYNSVGINGYGVFFLGTGIEGNFEATDTDNKTLTCSKQIDGYYLKNISDFGMFPLDQITEQYKKDKNQITITIVTGGLYYECKEKTSNTPYNGVYGYIKWNYGYNNTHEIRVGIDESGKWIPESPLEIIYSENTWNEGRSLSGTYHSSLAKNGKVANRLFGDISIMLSGENIPDSGTYEFSTTNIAPLIPIDYSSQYKTNNLKIYIRSSEPGTNLFYRNIFSHDGGSTLNTGSLDDIEMENVRTSGGFYGQFVTDLPVRTGMRAGNISADFDKYDQKWEGTIVYEIVNATPEITYSKAPRNVCRPNINIDTSASNYPLTFKYVFTDTTGDCERIGNFWINYGHYTGGAAISGNYGEYIVTGNFQLTDDQYNGKYLCFLAKNDIAEGYRYFLITGLDTTPPIIDTENTVFTGFECSRITGYVQASETGECNAPIQGQFSEGGNPSIRYQGENVPNSIWQRVSYRSLNKEVGTKKIEYIIKDNQENWTTGSFTMEWLDVPVTGKNFQACASFKSSKTIKSTVNWKIQSDAHAGSCEEVKAHNVLCEYGKAQIDGDILYYEYTNSSIPLGWYDNCKLTIGDGDTKTTIIISYELYNTGCIDVAPTIIGGDKFVDRCYNGNYKKIDGTYLYSSFCNYMPETLPSQTKPSKYTSGSTIFVDLNYTGTIPLKSYRMSCIENDTFCTKLKGGRNDIGCDNIYSGYFENIRNCTWSNKTNSGQCGYDRSGNQCETVCTDWIGFGRLGWCEREERLCPSCRECTQTSILDGGATCVEYRNTCGNKSPYCRRGCRNTPGSGYFEDILGCTYTDNTVYGSCISNEVLSILGIVSYLEGSNVGECWRGCSSSVIGSNDIFDYIQECKDSREELTHDTNGGIKCADGAMESARSKRETVPEDGIIKWNLENGNGCSNNGNLTPNGSKFQGERTVWVQVKDIDDNISEKRETDIVVYDLGDYRNVNLYGDQKTSPTAQQNSDIRHPSEKEIYWTINVHDTGRFYGIQSSIGELTANEAALLSLYQKYIGFSTRYSIAKNMTSAWMMKGICATGAYDQVTGTFNSRINNDCTCYGEDGKTCSGDYRDFISDGLTQWIPAIDYGCAKLSVYRKDNVTTGDYNSNPNLLCTGDITDIICDKVSTWNIHEFSRKDYGDEAATLCQTSCDQSQFGCYTESGNTNGIAGYCNKKTRIETIVTYEETKYNGTKKECTNYCKKEGNDCYDQNGNKIPNRQYSECFTSSIKPRYYYYYTKVEHHIEHEDVPVFFYYDNVITKSNCQDSGYDSCLLYVCSKYNTGYTFECPYKRCLNYGDGCLSYETKTFTSDKFIKNEKTQCSCIGTKEEPSIINGIVDENLYRCNERTGNNQSYECYECIKYECTEETDICKEDAYSKGVTYFTIDKPKESIISSHLQVERANTLGTNLIATKRWIDYTGGLVDLIFIGDHIGPVPVPGYSLEISQTNRQDRPDDVDININITNIRTQCLCDDGYFNLRVNTGLLNDFGLNFTNSIQGYVPNKFIQTTCNPEECEECAYSDNLLCTSETDLECFCKTHPNDIKCNACKDNNSTGCLCNPDSCNYCYNENSPYTTEECDNICIPTVDFCNNEEELDIYCRTKGNQLQDKRCICRMIDGSDENLKTTDCLCSRDWCTNLYPCYSNPSDPCCMNETNYGCDDGECVSYGGYGTNPSCTGALITPIIASGYIVNPLCSIGDLYKENEANYSYCNCSTESDYDCNLANNNTCSGAFCSLYKNNSLGNNDIYDACNCIDGNMNNRDTQTINGTQRQLFPEYLQQHYSGFGYNNIIFKVIGNNTPRCSCITNYKDSFGSNDDYCRCNPDNPQCMCAKATAVGLFNIINQPIEIGTGSLTINGVSPEISKRLNIQIDSVNPIYSCSGSLVFKGNPESCPGFDGHIYPDREICDGGNRYIEGKGINGHEVSPNCRNIVSITLQGEFDNNGEPTRTEWTGCKIIENVGRAITNFTNLNTDNLNDRNIEIEVSFILMTGDSAFKAGIAGNESKYIGTLNDALTKYSGDDSFYFYITNQSWITFSGYGQQQSGVLGSVDYDIRFSSGVTNEFYDIEGSAIIDGYQLIRQIKKPVFNYANPDRTLFVFPTY